MDRVRITHSETGLSAEVGASCVAWWRRNGWLPADEVTAKPRHRRAPKNSRPAQAGAPDDSDAGSSTDTTKE